MSEPTGVREQLRRNDGEIALFPARGLDAASRGAIPLQIGFSASLTI